MTELEFLRGLVEDLEIEEEVTMVTNFRELEDWSSLMGFSMLAFIAENFNKKILVEDFLKLETFEDVYKFIR